MRTGLVLTAPCTLTLYNFSTRQHLFHWTRSVTIEQPRLTLVYCKMWDVIQNDLLCVKRDVKPYTLAHHSEPCSAGINQAR